MRFKVSRTSDWNNEKPCDEAIFEDGYWQIVIDNLLELRQLVEKEGRIIISKFGKTFELEIYDDWRE